MPERQRVFFALWPAPELAERLHALGAGGKGRATRVEDLHLTLAFIGEVDAAQLDTLRIIAAGLTLPDCELVIDQLGYWRHNRILWAGPAELPPALRAFVAELHAALRAAGFALDEREFAAHITLLRNAEDMPDGVRIAPLRWRVTDWCLAVSARGEGARRYRLLAGWPAG